MIAEISSLVSMLNGVQQSLSRHAVVQRVEVGTPVHLTISVKKVIRRYGKVWIKKRSIDHDTERIAYKYTF